MNREQVCYYRLHIGCPNATNANCQLCAERLTRAVNQMLRSVTTSDAEANRNEGASIDEGSMEHMSDLRSAVLSYAKECS